MEQFFDWADEQAFFTFGALLKYAIGGMLFYAFGPAGEKGDKLENYSRIGVAASIILIAISKAFYGG